MLAGTSTQSHDGKKDCIKALPPEVRQIIFLNFSYALQLKLRTVAKYWKETIEYMATLPLLNTVLVKRALSYTATKTTEPCEIGLPQLAQNYAYLSLCPDSKDSLIMRFMSKASYETASGEWCSKEIEPPIQIPVAKVYLFALLKVGFDQQYLSLETREQRHAFITDYMQYPNTAKYPRSLFLKNQSHASLLRLKESLARYQDPRYQELSLEVDQAIEVRRAVPKSKVLQIR